MTDDEIVAIRDEYLPSQGEAFDCIAFARAILKQSRHEMTSKLIDAWCATHGGQPIPWAKAVEIVAVLNHMPDAKKARLLSLDGDGPPESGDHQEEERG